MNLPVQAERCDLNILLQQMQGEFTGRFAAAKLTPVISSAAEPLYIMADGRHMWRIKVTLCFPLASAGEILAEYL